MDAIRRSHSALASAFRSTIDGFSGAISQIGSPADMGRQEGFPSSSLRWLGFGFGPGFMARKITRTSDPTKSRNVRDEILLPAPPVSRDELKRFARSADPLCHALGPVGVLAFWQFWHEHCWRRGRIKSASCCAVGTLSMWPLRCTCQNCQNSPQLSGVGVTSGFT